MQKAYLMALFEIAEKDPNVLLLLADSGTSYDILFQKALPDQIMDFGIAEENMVAAAAGMASCGKTPFVFTAGAFLAYRSLEYIRDDVCLQNHNVKFIGMGTGLAWSTLGPTHHTTEDLGILRSLPNLMVLSASSPSVTNKCVHLAYEHQGPVYVRIGMGGENEIYENDYQLSPGKNQIVHEGTDIVIYSTGVIVNECLSVAEKLANYGISAQVEDIISIVPFDEGSVIRAATKGKAIFTVEEHSIIGGIGSAVAETLARNGLSSLFVPLGLNHVFASGYGTHSEVRQQNALDSDSIVMKILENLRA